MEDKPPSQEAESRPKTHSGFENRLREKLSPGYTGLTKAIDDVSRLWVLNSLQPASLRELMIDYW